MTLLSSLPTQLGKISHKDKKNAKKEMMRQDKRTRKYEYEIFETKNGNER